MLCVVELYPPILPENKSLIQELIDIIVICVIWELGLIDHKVSIWPQSINQLYMCVNIELKNTKQYYITVIKNQS